MKLFWTNIHPTGELPHPHACWSVCWIFHSCFACTVNHFYYHLVSPCIYCLIFFQFPVSESGQPWPRLCLHQGYIAQSREGRLTFLSKFAHSCPTLASVTILHISGGQWLLGSRNCANMSMSQESFPARIAQCAIPVVSSQTGVCIS